MEDLIGEFNQDPQDSDPILKKKLIETVRIINNALVESFAIHTWNIIAFLYLPRMKKDEITALDFVNDPRKWEEQRGKLEDSELLDEAKTRADKEIAHLTWKRISGAPPEKEWPFYEIGQAIKEKLKIFAENADKNKLHEDVRNFVNSLS